MKKIIFIILIVIFTINVNYIFGLTIGSTSFSNNGLIPQKYTCDGDDGKNISPNLLISDIPKKAKCLLLLFEDPDARSVAGKTYMHLIAQFNVKGNVISLNEGSLNEGSLKNGIQAIANDSGSKEYKGPCPPTGTHNYYFTVFALKECVNLDSKNGLSIEYFRDSWNRESRFYKENKENILAEAQFMGKYTRKKK